MISGNSSLCGERKGKRIKGGGSRASLSTYNVYVDIKYPYCKMQSCDRVGFLILFSVFF